jgi:hypothetical protein
MVLIINQVGIDYAGIYNIIYSYSMKKSWRGNLNQTSFDILTQ